MLRASGIQRTIKNSVGISFNPGGSTVWNRISAGLSYVPVATYKYYFESGFPFPERVVDLRQLGGEGPARWTLKLGEINLL